MKSLSVFAAVAFAAMTAQASLAGPSCTYFNRLEASALQNFSDIVDKSKPAEARGTNKVYTPIAMFAPNMWTKIVVGDDTHYSVDLPQSPSAKAVFADYVKNLEACYPGASKHRLVPKKRNPRNEEFGYQLVTGKGVQFVLEGSHCRGAGQCIEAVSLSVRRGAALKGFAAETYKIK